MLLELLFQPLEQGERIGGCAGETADHLAILAQPADLAGIGLHHRIAHADLTVAGDHRAAFLAHPDDGGAVPLFHMCPAHVVGGEVGSPSTERKKRVPSARMGKR